MGERGGRRARGDGAFGMVRRGGVVGRIGVVSC